MIRKRPPKITHLDRVLQTVIDLKVELEEVSFLEVSELLHQMSYDYLQKSVRTSIVSSKSNQSRLSKAEEEHFKGSAHDTDSASQSGEEAQSEQSLANSEELDSGDEDDNISQNQVLPGDPLTLEGSTRDMVIAKQVKLTRLSSGLAERFTKKGPPLKNWKSAIQRVCQDWANFLKPISDKELECLKHLKKKTKISFAHNTKLYWSEKYAGTPDAVAYDDKGRIVSIAEFKTYSRSSSESQKRLSEKQISRQIKQRIWKGTLQLRVQLAATKLKTGYLVIYQPESASFKILEIKLGQEELNDLHNRYLSFVKILHEAEKHPLEFEELKSCRRVWSGGRLGVQLLH